MVGAAEQKLKMHKQTMHVLQGRLRCGGIRVKAEPEEPKESLSLLSLPSLPFNNYPHTIPLTRRPSRPA